MKDDSAPRDDADPAERFEAPGLSLGPPLGPDCVDVATLADLYEERLAPEAREPAERHVLQCERCREGLAQLRRQLAEAFNRHFDRVRRIVRLRLGPEHPRADEPELVQEAFLLAADRFERLDLDDSGCILELAAIVEERLRDAAARRAADQRAAADARVARLLGNQPPPSPDNPSVRHLEEAIAHLSPADRELIVLRNYAGAAWDEIARRTGQPTPAEARIAHSRVLVILAEMLRPRDKPAGRTPPSDRRQGGASAGG